MGLCLTVWFTGRPVDTHQGKLQCHLAPVWEEFALETTDFNHETFTLEAPRLHFQVSISLILHGSQSQRPQLQ